MSVVSARRIATRREGAQRRAAALLLTPFVLLLIGVFLIPVLYAIGLSFFSETHSGLGFGAPETAFAGLRNYVAVLSDPSFLNGVGVTVLYGVIFVPAVLIGALALALLFDSGLVWMRQLSQTVLFIPHAVPGIIATLIWLYLYTPGISPVLNLLGAADLRISFLGLELLLPSLVNIGLWSGVGYNAVIFFAALRAIPREMIEAAEIDGAGVFRTATMIKVPMIKASLTTVAIFSTIGALQLFTEPMLLSQATPLIGPRYTPNMYIFDAAFTRNNYGLASAASVLLLIVCCVLSYIVTRGAAGRTTPRRRIRSPRKAEK